MKIAAVRTHLLDHRLETAFESASMRFDRRSHVLVEIECDDGTVGWGECLGPARANAADVPKSKRQSPPELARTGFSFRSRGAYSAVSLKPSAWSQCTNVPVQTNPFLR